MRLYNGVRYFDRPSAINVRRLDLGALPMIAKFHHYGIRVDLPYLAHLEKDFVTRQSGIEFDIFSAIGAGYQDFHKSKYQPFNIGSPDHVGRLLFQHLKVQGNERIQMTSGGEGGEDAAKASTAGDVLEKYRDRHPACAMILDWRELDKLLGTYVRPLQVLADADHRIHTRFSVTTAATGRLSSSRPNCFTGDTEILTKYGWIRFNEYTPEKYGLVAQWDNGIISFVNITGQTFDAHRPVIRLSNERTDLACTEDHRCLLFTRRNEKKVVDAKDYPSDHKQLHAGLYAAPKNGLNLRECEIQLLVALQADASRNVSGWDVSFKKERKIERFREILNKCRVVFREVKKDINGRVRFYLQDKDSAVRKLLGESKTFGSWVLDMSARQLFVFTEEIWHWDGCFTRKNHYASRVKSNADWVQTALTLSGQSANVRRYVSQGGSVSWQVDVRRCDYGFTTNTIKEKLEPQAVYCVSVPSTFLLVRRNGKVCVTGNCQNIPTKTLLGKMIRQAFIASPGNVLVSNDLSQIEMRWAAHLSQDPTMMGVFVRNEDIHDRTACEIFGRNLDEITALKNRVKKGAATTTTEEAIYKYFTQFERLPSKTIGFGILYGQTAPGLYDSIMLSKDPNWTDEERRKFEGEWTLARCERLIEQWYEVYNRIREWMELQFSRARRFGMVWDAFGRMRLVPEVFSAHKRIKSEGLRKSGNHGVQSSAQGTIKLAMAALDPISDFFNTAPGVCWPLLQIHDELIHEVDRGQAKDYADVASEEMEKATPISIPIKSSSDIAERWGDLK